MVYAVPLADGSFGVAQSVEAMSPFTNVIFVALFADRHNEIPERLDGLDPSRALSLVTTWRRHLNRGDWISIALAPLVIHKREFPDERLAQTGYVGAKTFDAMLLARFLSAWHGLLPWNVMKDPDYYDALLRPGLSRPSAAVLLDDEARLRYRRENFGLDA
ncbi:MAG: hypothetical protein U0941_11870 [Planctomycetaceae bacterium]